MTRPAWFPLPAGLLAAMLVVASAVACENGAAPATPEATLTPAVTPSSAAGSPTPDLTPTPPSSPSPTPAPTPTSTPEPFEGSRGPAQGEGTAPVPPGALLVQVRYGRHENFDRIVFQFENGLPGYRIEYVQPPILGDFSGLPVDIAGGAFLRAHFSVAAAHDPETGDRTYLGPLELGPGLPSLLEAEVTGDFEGGLTWVLGLSEKADFRVLALAEPFLIVIDVAHA